MVSPTYEGACSDVTSAAEACHGAGVPLVVDEAHGAHLAFLGEAQPPPSRSSEEEGEGEEGEEGAALRCGADLVVQSAHKTLGSLTQSAFLHLGQGGVFASGGTEGDGGGSGGGDDFSIERAVSDALATVQSSSPSYLLLASLDAARWDLAGTNKNAKRRLMEAARIADGVREELSSVEGINVLDLGGEKGSAAGCVGTDPLRLTVSFEG
ncbi:unnamed protein product, partial [Ectocarpus sp. 8 AP-2014]